MITVFFDFETGGVEPQHPSIEIGAVAMENGRELSAFESVISFKPSECSPEALALNHYDPARWSDAPTAPVVAARFAAWLKPFQAVTLTSKRTGRAYTVARMAGYNVGFDGPRLKALFGNGFMPCELLMRDVLQVALFYFDARGERLENFKLTTVAQHFGIATDGAHGALADARMTAAVYQALIETMDI